MRALRPSAEKVCIYCRERKPASEYHSHRYTTRTGRESVRLNSACRSCHGEKTKARKVANPERTRAQSRDYKRRNAAVLARRNAAYRRANPQRIAGYSMKHKHGLTMIEYEALLCQQGGVCKVCRQEAEPVGIKRRLHIDHCHETGRIRGLLCHNCNVSLGLMKDDPARIRALADYLDAARD